MNISQTMIIHNALIFGVATLAALIIAFILDRQVRRVIGFVLRSLSVADKP